MYSCPKDEHIQELTMKPVSERNKIKQDMYWVFEPVACHTIFNKIKIY